MLVERALAVLSAVRCCICKGRTHHHLHRRLVLSVQAVQEGAEVVWNDSVLEEQRQVEVEVGELMASTKAAVEVELKGSVTEEVVEALGVRIQGLVVHERAMPAAEVPCRMVCAKQEEA